MAHIVRSRIHSLRVRIFHWINAFSMILMIMSGWRIYNASPLFDFKFPDMLTLGGWLGGALQWHFAAMWLFVINLLIYIVGGIVSGHFKRSFFPLRPSEVVQDLLKAAKGKLPHEVGKYNAVQKSFYVGIILIMLLTITSGLVVWKSVQFQTIGLLMGGYESARLVHFAGMSLICAFIVVHLALVAIVPSTFLPMITGWAKHKEEANHVA